jgi:amino acid adenylation domain-containing protein
VKLSDVAVVDALGQLTYAELERESSQLAARLRELGVGPERCVGVLVERSARFVVAALGILKSGGAYVPLDPSTPVDRAAYVLADAGVSVLVTQPEKIDKLPVGPWQTIDVDCLPTSDTAFLAGAGAPEDLAYVIYTSGSAGLPKGVEITHASLSNLIEWHQKTFGITSADRASLVAGLGFDAAVWEIWPYLAAGATICIADEDTRRCAASLREWMLSEQITIGFLPTILAEQMIQMPWPKDARLRYVLTGGDVLHRRPNRNLPFVLVNNYGPSECTVVATSGVVSPEETNRFPSIGRPIANATAFVLDDKLQPVSDGESGELCLAGALVGRGYRNMPDATENAFVTYTNGTGESQRIYRTGDRVRLLDDGEFEYLGRFDDQLQIRGYRVEPGEIVARLNQCAGIASSAVVAHPADSSEPSLLAYVVSDGSAPIDAASLRSALAQKLPEYMLPSTFVSMPAFPVTPNGKLDRAALPAPSADNVLANVCRAAAATDDPVRREIATMVESLLDRPSVDPEANFFMIGGHSMLAVQLAARIRDAFGVKLTLRQLFTAPTIAALSSEVTALQNHTYA